MHLQPSPKNIAFSSRKIRLSCKRCFKIQWVMAIFAHEREREGDRPGKSCKWSSSGKFRALQCPQNSVNCDTGWSKIYVLNVGVAWWNPQILMTSPQFIALHPQFSILNASFSILLPQISLIQPQFCIFGSSSSILSQKNGIFYSKSPQNSVISNKMSASTACSFFQVCTIGEIFIFLLSFSCGISHVKLLMHFCIRYLIPGYCQ